VWTTFRRDFGFQKPPGHVDADLLYQPRRQGLPARQKVVLEKAKGALPALFDKD
jgi:hypothetical protein